MGLHAAVIQAGLFQVGKKKPKTEDDAYHELMDNDESVTKTPGITSGGPGSGWTTANGHIMHEKIGGQKGSNAGGLYKGSDGVTRYVKQYANKSQGRAEVLANTIYNDLGIGAPKAQIFGDGDFASDIIPDGTTLQDQGLTKTSAREVLKGFAADVLLANWDAVGLTYDNILMKNGKAHRIDNGATFTHRAQGGAKPNNLLYTDSEYTGFFNPKINNEYSRLAKAAGYSSADQIPDIKQQVSKIVALETKSGGWDNYLKSKAPYLTPQEHTTFAQMLSARTMALSNRHPDVLQGGGPGSGWFTEGGHVSHYTSTAYEAQFNSIGFELHHSAANKGDYYALKSKGQSGKYTGFTYHKDGSWKLGIIKPNGDLSAHKTVEGKSVKGKGLATLLTALKNYGYSGPDTNKSVPMAPSVKPAKSGVTADKPIWKYSKDKTMLDSMHKTFTEGDGYTYQKTVSNDTIANHIYTKPNPDAGGAVAKSIQENPYAPNIINMGKTKENGDPLPAKKDITTTPTEQQLKDATHPVHSATLQKLGFKPQGMSKNADGQDTMLWNKSGGLSVVSDKNSISWELFDQKGKSVSTGFGAEKLEQSVKMHDTSPSEPKADKPKWTAVPTENLEALHGYLKSKGFNYKETYPANATGSILHKYENQYGEKKFLSENPNDVHGVLDDATYKPIKQDKEPDSQEGIPKSVVTDKAFRTKVASAVTEALKSVAPDFGKGSSYDERNLLGYSRDGQMKIRVAVAKAVGVGTNRIINVNHEIASWVGSSHDQMRKDSQKVINGDKDADPGWVIEHEVTKQQLEKAYGKEIELYRGIGATGDGYGTQKDKLSNQIQALKLLANSAAAKFTVNIKSKGADSWSSSSGVASGFNNSGVVLHQKVPTDYVMTSYVTNADFMNSEQEFVVAFPKAEIPVQPEHIMHAASDGIVDGAIGLLRSAGWKITVKGNTITIYDNGPDWMHPGPVKKNITAGGPGSGRHKEFGTMQVPKNKFGKPILSERQKRSLQNHVGAGTKEQRKADMGESLVKDAVRGRAIGTDSEPFDVLSADGKHAIEVKTLIKQGNDKITMKNDAMERKYGWGLKNKVHIHTVVLDMRNGGSTPKAVYHREGVGSFRLGNMTPLPNGLKDVNDAIHGRL